MNDKCWFRDFKLYVSFSFAKLLTSARLDGDVSIGGPRMACVSKLISGYQDTEGPRPPRATQ